MADDLADVVLQQHPPVRQERIDGVVIGVLVDFDEGGHPRVALPEGLLSGGEAGAAWRARTVAALGREDIGCELALMFESGDPARPLILGRMHRPLGSPGVAPAMIAERDGERLELRADREIVLRCGRASITLTRAGKILLRGAYLLSRSSGVNRIKGGSVQIN
ncbi:hypothetical protein HOP52_06940 [Halomonas campisalis]|uniref:DUF6484 domain-containing protein n=1 Tax=Billgrantia campisalis TaxID=74661 RepID=A0ABS9P6U2_9GAMM|nr:DUF6484 domain-containing protein [Halomonas campisalis]MCG6657501.1 hypothetical protein [Halomonas campisalis]MDR5863152.1 DUF6484 domain-containing protein [Halomonas campisalis]